MTTEADRAQQGYEAGLAAWAECVDRVMDHIPENEDSATPFIAGFLEATFMALIVADDKETALATVKAAFANALAQASLEDLKLSGLREH